MKRSHGQHLEGDGFHVNDDSEVKTRQDAWIAVEAAARAYQAHRAKWRELTLEVDEARRRMETAKASLETKRREMDETLDAVTEEDS